MSAEEAIAGGYAAGDMHENTDFESYLSRVKKKAAKRAVSKQRVAMWGRPVIEGHMFCQKCVIKLHSIEKCHAHSGDVIGHQLIDSSGSRSMDENTSCCNDPQMIHRLNEGCVTLFQCYVKHQHPTNQFTFT